MSETRNRSDWADGRDKGKEFVRSMIPAAGWTSSATKKFCHLVAMVYETYRDSEELYHQVYANAIKCEANATLLPLMIVLGKDGRSVATPIGDGYDWNGMHLVRKVNNSLEPTAAEIQESAELDSHIRISMERAEKLAERNMARSPGHRQTALLIGRGVCIEADMDAFDSFLDREDELQDVRDMIHDGFERMEEAIYDDSHYVDTSG